MSGENGTSGQEETGAGAQPQGAAAKAVLYSILFHGAGKEDPLP